MTSTGAATSAATTATTTVTTVPDGRHARRERGRAAVVDALFEFLLEGRLPPTVDEVANRAGVSVASVFRYFDGIEDMQRHAFARFRTRFAHLYEIENAGRGSRAPRAPRRSSTPACGSSARRHRSWRSPGCGRSSTIPPPKRSR